MYEAQCRRKTISVRPSSTSITRTFSTLATAALLYGTALAAEPTPTCSATVPIDSLRDALGSAEAAFSRQDIQGVTSAVSRAREKLPCVDGALTTEDAAHVHRVEALSSFLDRDLEGAVIHYRAVIHLKPEYSVPSGIAPQGGPLHGQFELARKAPEPALRDIPAPVEGGVLIDGSQRSTAPANLPFVFQRVDERGAIRETALLESGANLPEYRTIRELKLVSREAASAIASSSPSPPKRQHRTRRAVLIGGAGLAALGGAACLGIAAQQKDAYETAVGNGPDRPADNDSIMNHARQLDGHINRNRGYLRGAAGLGALGLALGVSGAF